MNTPQFIVLRNRDARKFAVNVSAIQSIQPQDEHCSAGENCVVYWEADGRRQAFCETFDEVLAKIAALREPVSQPTATARQLTTVVIAVNDRSGLEAMYINGELVEGRPQFRRLAQQVGNRAAIAFHRIRFEPSEESTGKFPRTLAELSPQDII